MRHYIPLSESQNARLVSAALLLPERQRGSFVRSVEYRINELPRFDDDDLDRTIAIVLGCYGVGACLYNERTRAERDKQNGHRARARRV
jgi:hypothetical protein